MRIIIDIKHPAHVHFFRNFISIMKKKGKDILVTSREKEMTSYLLDKYCIDHHIISSIGKGKIDLAKELIERDYRFYKICKKNKPNLLLELMGVTAAPVGFLLRIPSLVFYDTENAHLTNSLAYRFCTKFVTPECYRKPLGDKNIRYKGYHELSYLHPSYFKPDSNVLKELGLKRKDRFTIIRFVSWGASHDIGHKGISFEHKIRAVREFERYGRVFISSEKPLSGKLERYRYSLPQEKMHSLLHYATLLYGESATMASESSVLGTRSIYIDDEGRGYTDEQEKRYGLVSNFTESLRDQERSIEKGIEILKDPSSKKNALRQRQRLLDDTIDVTSFMVDLASRYG